MNSLKKTQFELKKNKQFVAEVDAFNIDVGTMLSYRSGTSARLKPRTFFMRRLTAAKRNCAVGDREGSEQPLIVWTNHKNLTYLHSVKRLNAWQARWSLFFARFNFSISYCPGSRNIKTDTLSQQFESGEETMEVAPILPANCEVGEVM